MVQSRSHPIEAPAVRYTLQFVFARVPEHEAAPRNQVLHGLGHADLAGAGGGCNPSADRDSHTSYLAVDHPAFARVQPRTDLEADVADPFDDLERAADPTCRAVERREEAVARRIDLVSLPACERAPDDRMMFLDEVLPPSVADRRHPFGRADDVGE